MIELLLEHEVKVSEEEWVSTLNTAAKNGHLETVKLALERGTNPEAKLLLRTPLTRAADEGHIDVAKVLLEWKADPNLLTSTERRSALSFAASRDDKAMLKLLLKYGADVNFRGYRGRSTIWHVTDKEAAEILLDAGADVSDLGKLLKQVLSSGLRELAEFFFGHGGRAQ